VRVSLSSPLTFVNKFVFPVIWAGGWSYATALLFRGQFRAPWWEKWLFLLLLVVGAFVLSRVAYGLKRVELEDLTLYISNYRKEIAVPITEVIKAGWDPYASIDNRSLVALKFKSETAFGRMIEFMPRSPEAVDLLRARLGPEVGGPPERSELAAELHGRGTV